MDTAPLRPRSSAQLVMHLMALAATAHLLYSHFMHVYTSGARPADDWSSAYIILLCIYAASIEYKQFVQGPIGQLDLWEEHVRKGGLIIALWVGLRIVLGQMHGSGYPVPADPRYDPTMGKVMLVFFGTYVARQYRKAGGGLGDLFPGRKGKDEEELQAQGLILDYLRERFQAAAEPEEAWAGRKELVEATGISRSAAGRALAVLTQDKLIERQGSGPGVRYRFNEPKKTA